MVLQTPGGEWAHTALDWTVPPLGNTKKPPTLCGWLQNSCLTVPGSVKPLLYPCTSEVSLNMFLASQLSSPQWGACSMGHHCFPSVKSGYTHSQPGWEATQLLSCYISGKAQLSHVVLEHFLYLSISWEKRLDSYP